MSDEKRNLILIDTDAGIDDAWAILMILAAAKEDPFIKIVGITCVFGNTDVDNTCINVLRTLESSQRLDIPVFKGSPLPLISNDTCEKKIGGFFGLDGFGMAEHKSTPDCKLIHKENAVVALARLVSENKGKVSLLCLGPLTNIALAIRTYPDFVDNVREIIVMGGNYKGAGNATDCAEFNFYADPEAAHIVLNSGIRRKILVPWETCCDLTFPLEWRDNVLGACHNTSIQLMNHVERPLRVKPTFVSWLPWDQVAAAVALAPNAVSESTTVHLTVELQGSHTRGQGVVWRDIVLGDCNNSSIQLMNHVERPLRAKPTFVSWMPCDQIVALIALAPTSVTECIASRLTVELYGQYTRGQVVVSHKLRNEPNYPRGQVVVSHKLRNERKVVVVTNIEQKLLEQSLLKIHNL